MKKNCLRQTTKKKPRGGQGRENSRRESERWKKGNIKIRINSQIRKNMKKGEFKKNLPVIMKRIRDGRKARKKKKNHSKEICGKD